MLVITVGKGTHGFTLDREIGNFILTHPNLQIPADTSEFAINTSNARFWEPPVHRYVTECQAGKTRRSRPRFQYALDRLAGCRGAPYSHARRGVHVPKDMKDRSTSGWLRLLYEANPMSLLVEHAGGHASTGRAAHAGGRYPRRCISAFR